MKIIKNLLICVIMLQIVSVSGMENNELVEDMGGGVKIPHSNRSNFPMSTLVLNTNPKREETAAEKDLREEVVKNLKEDLPKQREVENIRLEIQKQMAEELRAEFERNKQHKEKLEKKREEFLNSDETIAKLAETEKKLIEGNLVVIQGKEAEAKLKILEHQRQINFSSQLDFTLKLAAAQALSTLLVTAILKSSELLWHWYNPGPEEMANKRNLEIVNLTADLEINKIKMEEALRILNTCKQYPDENDECACKDARQAFANLRNLTVQVLQSKESVMQKAMAAPALKNQSGTQQAESRLPGLSQRQTVTA